MLNVSWSQSLGSQSTDHKLSDRLPLLSTSPAVKPGWRVMETGHQSTRAVETGLYSPATEHRRLGSTKLYCLVTVCVCILPMYLIWFICSSDIYRISCMTYRSTNAVVTCHGVTWYAAVELSLFLVSQPFHLIFRVIHNLLFVFTILCVGAWFKFFLYLYKS